MIDPVDIARVCHEANRAYCYAQGDESQRPWTEAPAWQRQSAIDGVRFALAHPDSTPEMQHDAWCKDKFAAGWTYGEVKDPQAKTHPCLLRYSQLPEAQRKKGLLFLAVVRALA